MTDNSETSHHDRKNICFLIYDDMETLDFTGPYDVFVQANAAAGGDEEVFNLFLVAINDQPVTSDGGIRMLPDYAMNDPELPPIHTLIIPGTPGYRHIKDYDALTSWISDQSDKVTDMVSVCVGAFLLVGGMKTKLNGRQITTHHGAVRQLQNMIDDMGVKASVRPGVRYLSDGNVYTSGGVSAGIDLGFFLITRYLGTELTARVANIMEYNRTINWSME